MKKNISTSIMHYAIYKLGCMSLWCQTGFHENRDPGDLSKTHNVRKCICLRIDTVHSAALYL